MGRLQLGTYLEVLFQPTTGNNEPALPDAVPTIQVRRTSDGAVVHSGLMPVLDKTVSPGLFYLPLFLGFGFAAGGHTLRLSCTIDGDPVLDTRSFTIVAGGDVQGQALAMVYFHKPHADFVVFQTENGSISRGKNPYL
jgi:hypothetical protein